MSLPNIPRRPSISYSSSQGWNQTVERPASVNEGGAHSGEPTNPAVLDFLHNIGLDATNHSMGAEYPGDRPIPKNEESRLMERFNDLLNKTRANRADRNTNVVDEAPAVHPPVTLDNRIPVDPKPGTNSNPHSFPNNLWIIG